MTELHAPTTGHRRELLFPEDDKRAEKSWLKETLIKKLSEDLAGLRKTAKEAVRSRDRSALACAVFVALSNIAGMRDLRGAFVFVPFTIYALWRAWSAHGMYQRAQQEIACHRLNTDLELAELRDET